MSAEAVHAALTPFDPHVAHAVHGTTPDADQVAPFGSPHLAFGGLHCVSVRTKRWASGLHPFVFCLIPFVQMVHAVHGDSPVADQVVYLVADGVLNPHL